MQPNKILDQLVLDNSISSYRLENIDENGKIGKSKCRNTERLTLNFPNGNKLVLDTFCSGCLEDTCFFISNGETDGNQSD